MAAAYCSGDLKHPVTVERETQVDDGAGGFTSSWATLATVWCAIENPNGRERMEDQRLISETNKVFICRYRTDIQTTDRINWRGVLYNIRWIRNIDERDTWLRIMADGGVVQ